MKFDKDIFVKGEVRQYNNVVNDFIKKIRQKNLCPKKTEINNLI